MRTMAGPSLAPAGLRVPCSRPCSCSHHEMNPTKAAPTSQSHRLSTENPIGVRKEPEKGPHAGKGK